MVLGGTLLISKAGYHLVVSQNEITYVFEVLVIFWTACPFSKVQL